jgi:tetratricopeptide (TPR) repeat protein
MSELRLNPFSRIVGRRRFLQVLLAISILGPLALGAGVYLWADYQFRAAREACEKSRFSQARDHISRYLGIWPGDADAHFLAARIERRLSQFKKAETHLQAYKRARGATDEFQTEWVLLRAQAGELAQLEESLWSCIKNDHPQTLEILETLAGCFIRESRFHLAQTCLNEWLKRDPTNAIALEWRGMANEYLQAREDAVADYRQVLKQLPDRWPIRLQLAVLLIDLTRYTEAARELEILRKTHGQEEPVQLAWGRYLFGQGKTEEARQVFSRLTSGKAKSLLVFYYLGKLEREPAEAEKWFRKALEIEPANLEARFALYASLQQAGRHKEAAQELRLYETTRRDQEQTKALYEKMERAPNNPDTLSKLGTHLLERFDNPRGVQLLLRALSLDPNHLPAHQALARYYEKKNQPEQAARHRSFSPAP